MPIKVDVKAVHNVNLLHPGTWGRGSIRCHLICESNGTGTYSSQFLVFVEWIPTQAHDHWVYFGLFLAEPTQRRGIHSVVGTTSRHLGVTEVYTRRCDLDHLGERVIWQIGYPPTISLISLFIRMTRLTGGTPEILTTSSETLLNRPGKVDREGLLGSLGPNNLWPRCSVCWGLGDWATVW